METITFDVTVISNETELQEFTHLTRGELLGAGFHIDFGSCFACVLRLSSHLFTEDWDEIEYNGMWFYQMVK